MPPFGWCFRASSNFFSSRSGPSYPSIHLASSVEPGQGTQLMLRLHSDPRPHGSAASPTPPDNSQVAPAPTQAAISNSDTTFTSDAPIPGDFFRHVDNDPRLHSILGVAIVFHKPPSVLQISRVLGIPRTEVQAALLPISSYLDDLGSNVKLQQPLKDSLLRRPGLPAIYHGLVAKWCLVDPSPDGPMPDAK
ncbi:hypothetical protein B0H12DRAFT_79538 [Mycena haematopus]|nr:hypothetical protein B0H12DRAFT_79538 [Mycena haematopus]